jgi:hypothetical protein
VGSNKKVFVIKMTIAKSFPKPKSYKGGDGFTTKGFSHREHRSKKNRRKFHREKVNLKLKLEKIKEKEIDSDLSEV